MYRDDVKDLKRQKLIYDLKMIKEFIIIYGKLIFSMPNEIKSRKELVFLIREWFLYSKREREILNFILLEYGNIEDDLNVEEVLAILDEIFENMFDYYDDILEGYEGMLETRDVYRSKYNKADFETLSEEKKDELIKLIMR